MTIPLTCRCGERFEVAHHQAGTKQPCPACDKLVDVPGEPFVKMASMKYLNQAADHSEEAVAHLPLCPDCKGTGRCRLCGGYRKVAGSGEPSGCSAIFFVSMWANFYAKMLGMDTPNAGIKGCVSCNGRGKCYQCDGLGRVADSGD